jgi:hypothetical protein
MNLTTALTIYHVSPREQAPLRDYDLIQLCRFAPELEPALMELQYRRTQMEVLDEELMIVKQRLASLEAG